MAGQRTILIVAVILLKVVLAAQTPESSSDPAPNKNSPLGVRTANGPKVRWRFLVYEKTLHNQVIPPQDRDSNAAESLSLSCDIEMSDPRLLVAMAPGATIERITDGQGNDLTIGLGDFQSAGTYRPDPFLIRWLRFNRRIGEPDARGSRVRQAVPRLDLDVRLRERARGGIRLLKGYYSGLMAESIRYVDVPFRPSDNWVCVTPELEIRVLEARNVPSMYHYKIEQRPMMKSLSVSLSAGDYYPNKFVLAEKIIVRNNSGASGFGGGVSSGGMGDPADGHGISKGSGIGRAEGIRYIIAINPTHKTIPFELEDIPLSAFDGPTQTAAPGSEKATGLSVMQHLRKRAVREKDNEISVTQAQVKPTSGTNRGKYFDVRWTSITHTQTFHNPIFSGRDMEQTLKLRCDAEILDSELVLGTCDTPIIEQVTDGKGRLADIGAAELRSGRMYYKTAQYRTSGPATPPSNLAQIEGKARMAIGLPLKERHRPKRTSELQPVRMVIRLDPGLIGRGQNEISQIKGHLNALTAESFRNIEVPFKPSDEWVRLTSDVQIQVARAWNDGVKYRYDIKERSRTPIRPGRLSIDNPLPDGIVVNRRFAGPGVPEKDRSIVKGGDSIPISAGGKGSVNYRVNGVDCQIKMIDYRIAVNPKHHRIPFEFEHIPLP